MVKIENPDLFPSYVYVSSPDEHAYRVRGQLFFDNLAKLGLHVDQVRGTAAAELGSWTLKIRRPCTILFYPVPHEDFGPQAKMLSRHPVAVIMDCHFPIMDLTHVIADEATLTLLEQTRPVMLANLAMADAVTVPHPAWAAELAEVNSNVYVLPDLVASDVFYSDDDDIDVPEDEWLAGEQSLSEFMLRFQEIAMAAMQHRRGAMAGAAG